MTATRVDRAALVRRALVELVSELGFRGTSMAAVAERAGVATGTAYVHYPSKDALVLAAYQEGKQDLGAAVAAIHLPVEPAERFRALWFGVYHHLAGDPVRARFLVQVDSSPMAGLAHDAAVSDNENQLIGAIGGDLMGMFVDLPALVLYDLSLGPAVRLVASGQTLPPDSLDRLASACWRAITDPQASTV
ncbi:MAG: TetR/AcrR family transcriptional regulator [Acidimicrobiia bacterium]|nr:TetR/AcrR family transcriptional regulator [Acidimicrobiia bacterium]